MEKTRVVINCALAGFFLLLGGTTLAWLIRTRPEAPSQQAFARVLEVAVRPATPCREETPVVAHGTVRPKNQVDIVPQVNGRLVQVHEDLAPGKLIPEGELLFEIDPTVYKSRVRQAEAEIRRFDALLARHDQELVNLNDRVANVERMLAIDEQDYLTSKELFEVKNVGTQRDVDQLYLKFLRQKDVWVELTSRRSLIPLLKQDTEAQLDIAGARLEQSQHQLDNTRITCPFRARVERADAYKSEVVTAHFSIAKLTDMEAFEISVGVDPRELRWLDTAISVSTVGRPVGNRSHTDGNQTHTDGNQTHTDGNQTHTDGNQTHADGNGTQTVGSRSHTDGDEAGPPVEVHWSLYGEEFSWRGRVTRFERVDEVTRTVRMVVEVRADDMTATVSAGNVGLAPNLSIGMYCRTELPIEPLLEALLVPRHAIYDNSWVYVFEPSSTDPDGLTGRLGRRQVPMLRSLKNSVLVDYRGREGTEVCELQPGEQIVVSPLTKPIVGMEVRLRETQVAVGKNLSQEPVWDRLASRSVTDWKSWPALVGIGLKSLLPVATDEGWALPTIAVGDNADGGRCPPYISDPYAHKSDSAPHSPKRGRATPLAVLGKIQPGGRGTGSPAGRGGG